MGRDWAYTKEAKALKDAAERLLRLWDSADDDHDWAFAFDEAMERLRLAVLERTA